MGRVIERSCWSPYQLSRLEDIPEVVVWDACSGSDRWYHFDALSEQDGGGGASRSLNRLVHNIILWGQTSSISLMAVHIPGCPIGAHRLSFLSRESLPRGVLSIEWSLDLVIQ